MKKSDYLIELNANSNIHFRLMEQLLEPFAEYKSKRLSKLGKFLTKLFRNKELSLKKLALVDETELFIKSFNGTKQELIDGLSLRKLRNEELSKSYRKNHYNLTERNKEMIFTQSGIWLAPVVKKGQLMNESNLAEAFHNALHVAKTIDEPRRRRKP